MKKQKKLTRKELNIYCQEDIRIIISLLRNGLIITAYERLKELWDKLGKENTD